MRLSSNKKVALRENKASNGLIDKELWKGFVQPTNFVFNFNPTDVLTGPINSCTHFGQFFYTTSWVDFRSLFESILLCSPGRLRHQRRIIKKAIPNITIDTNIQMINAPHDVDRPIFSENSFISSLIALPVSIGVIVAVVDSTASTSEMESKCKMEISSELLRFQSSSDFVVFCGM